ncbi:MAG: WG repeat-containing protein [Desulfobacteria bacterium]
MITRRQFLHRATSMGAYLGVHGVGSLHDFVSPIAQAVTVDRYPVRVSGKDGFIDRGGTVVIPPIFEEASTFSEGLARVKKDGYWGYMDKDGNMVIPPVYEQAGYFQCGLACVMAKGKGGYINHVGKMVTPLIFDDVYAFNEDLAAVVFDGYCGFIDTEGHMVIPQKFKAGAKPMTHGFGEGLASICVDGLYGYISRSGEIVIPPFATDAWRFSHGLASVRRGEDFYFIGRDGSPPFGNLCFRNADISFYEGLAAVAEKGSGKWGFINRQGNWMIPSLFEDAYGFSEGLSAVEVKGGLIGFIDCLGKIVIAPKWKLAGYFNKGIASVSDGHEWAYIDKFGKYIWKPKK